MPPKRPRKSSYVMTVTRTANSLFGKPRMTVEQLRKLGQEMARGAHRVEATTGRRSGGDRQAATDLATTPEHCERDKRPPSLFAPYKRKTEWR